MSEKDMEIQRMDDVRKCCKPLDSDFKKRLEALLIRSVVKNFQKEMKDEYFYKYEVQIQDIKFVTYMSDEEIEKSAKLSIDLLEEMKEIYNSGLGEYELRKRVATIENRFQDEGMRQLAIINVISSERMSEIIGEIEVVRRVGGAYAMLISTPCLKSAIYAVYDILVKDFDNEDLYCESAFFLLRAIMRMQSNEVK